MGKRILVEKTTNAIMHMTIDDALVAPTGFKYVEVDKSFQMLPNTKLNTDQTACVSMTATEKDALARVLDPTIAKKEALDAIIDKIVANDVIDKELKEFVQAIRGLI